ncbi:hypothetical protein OIU84_002816 [Salix udensis]|uniref:Uncharacterized protein n=1 Tax=Salix udensis TaxID=889485 RepID=A0AAD6K6G0_9ROSI|nr:hypothetical protein OIU84_002816 [Salix udensis]
MENGDSDEGYDSSLPVEKWCGDDRLYQWKGCWFRHQYLLGTRQIQSSPPACANIRSSTIRTAAAIFQQLCQHWLIVEDSGNSSAPPDPGRRRRTCRLSHGLRYSKPQGHPHIVLAICAEV